MALDTYWWSLSFWSTQEMIGRKTGKLNFLLYPFYLLPLTTFLLLLLLRAAHGQDYEIGN